MLEKDFCKIILDSARATGGNGYKIPDLGAYGGLQLKTNVNPFDMFFTLKQNDIYKTCFVEAKFLKEMKAFNLNRIEVHQAFWLSEMLKDKTNNVYVILGIHISRGNLVAYIFDWEFLKDKYEAGFSYHAKDLEKLEGNVVKNKIFKFENIIR